ncbi:MAG: hypothetical protein ACO2ZM_03420 [Francisellaceae bacterium]
MKNVAIPKDYKSLMQYLGERYADYRTIYAPTRFAHAGKSLITGLRIEGRQVKIYVDLAQLAVDSYSHKALRSFIDHIESLVYGQEPEVIISRCIEKFLDLYKLQLYPELISDRLSLYRLGINWIDARHDGRIILASLEKKIRSFLCHFPLTVSLKFIHHQNMARLGRLIIGKSRLIEDESLLALTVTIKLFVHDFIDNDKQLKLVAELKAFCLQLLHQHGLILLKMSVVLDFGLDCFRLGSLLHQAYLMGGHRRFNLVGSQDRNSRGSCQAGVRSCGF